MSDRLADMYEARYPGTDCSPAQKSERMERMLLRETGSIRPPRDGRRGRVRMVVPELPWQRVEGEVRDEGQG